LRKNKEQEGRVTMKINKIESLKYSAKSGSDSYRNCVAGNKHDGCQTNLPNNGCIGLILLEL
jgi:hypothetical protein